MSLTSFLCPKFTIFMGFFSYFLSLVESFLSWQVNRLAESESNYFGVQYFLLFDVL